MRTSTKELCHTLLAKLVEQHCERERDAVTVVLQSSYKRARRRPFRSFSTRWSMPSPVGSPSALSSPLRNIAKYDAHRGGQTSTSDLDELGQDDRKRIDKPPDGEHVT